ncbi:MAG: glycosyltransferase family 2 protein [Candidatus Hermodarchaeia archaeon]|jgi:glycosyltransferase involved in cell wall biosynthesis
MSVDLSQKSSALTITEPLVSVLISVYNAGEYLRSSVQSILSQSYSNLEILIINDGSTDGCMDSIADFEDSRIRIITQKNAGKAVALNRALEELTGEFYAIQDADDISYPQRIERQVECMLENPELAAVFTGYDIIVGQQRLAPLLSGKSTNECHRDIEQFRMPAHDATPMFRVSLVRKFCYEPTLRIGQGFDYILHIGEHHSMLVLGECLYSYRVHFDSTIRKNVLQRKQMIRNALERACERRGLNPSDYLSVNSERISRFRHRELEMDVVPHFMESVLDLRRADRNREALKTAFACLRLHPCDPYYYKPLAYFLAPLALIKYYRSIKAKTR